MQTFLLNPNIRLSKAQQIFNSVLTGIETGALEKNERLLSINEFSKKYSVARDTVEKAYIRLKKEKLIDSVKGKGYYVLGKPDKKLRVLFIFNKLSSYKKIIYDSFVHTLGSKATVDIFVHHYSPQLLRNCLVDQAGKYHYYVIMPHFFSYARENELLDTLNMVPSDQLILLDKTVNQLTDLKMAVYQDFKFDIYDALRSAAGRLRRYKTITVIFPDHSNHPLGINEGVLQFCKEQDLEFSTIPDTDNEKLVPGRVYVTLLESDLAILIKKIRQSEYQIGKDIGVISFNETVFKELLDITVITTDFEAMGKTTAKMVLSGKPSLNRNPFKLIIRNSL